MVDLFDHCLTDQPDQPTDQVSALVNQVNQQMIPDQLYFFVMDQTSWKGVFLQKKSNNYFDTNRKKPFRNIGVALCSQPRAAFTAVTVCSVAMTACYYCEKYFCK